MNFKTVFFFSLTHTQISLSAKGYFFNCLSAFSVFSSNETPHTAKIPFWFLETQGSTVDSIYGLLLLSRAPQDSKKYVIARKIDWFHPPPPPPPNRKIYISPKNCLLWVTLPKNVLFFIYSIEQNTKEIIWLRCYYLIKHEEAFLNGMAVQPISGNLAEVITDSPPITSVKVFGTAYWLIPLS